MKRWAAIAFLLLASAWPTEPADPSPKAADWRRAEPGWKYEWPRDHHVHPEFRSEWWYFTPDSRRFGYQLTFFRQGIRPPNAVPARSRFIVSDLKFAHFTITDVASGEFYFAQRFSRGAFGEAGFGLRESKERIAWLEDWSLSELPDGRFQIHAQNAGQILDLELHSPKPWVIHGRNGLSEKAEGGGHASHYYSGTRLRASGRLSVGGGSFDVSGDSWFDHEWATNQLTPDQAGWDWFSLQLDDGSELMLYRLRKKDGSFDLASSGTFIEANGQSRHLLISEMEVIATRRWHSARSGGDYPIAWKLRIPALALDLTVTTPVENQELVLQPVTYWEGLVDAVGTRSGGKVEGHGYVELTGYAGPITALSEVER
jgi:predicted secreted hydrolase